jgi:hypothetical protein
MAAWMMGSAEESDDSASFSRGHPQNSDRIPSNPSPSPVRSVVRILRKMASAPIKKSCGLSLTPLAPKWNDRIIQVFKYAW